MTRRRETDRASTVMRGLEGAMIGLSHGGDLPPFRQAAGPATDRPSRYAYRVAVEHFLGGKRQAKVSLAQTETVVERACPPGTCGEVTRIGSSDQVGL